MFGAPLQLHVSASGGLEVAGAEGESAQAARGGAALAGSEQVAGKVLHMQVGCAAYGAPAAATVTTATPYVLWPPMCSCPHLLQPITVMPPMY